MAALLIDMSGLPAWRRKPFQRKVRPVPSPLDLLDVIASSIAALATVGALFAARAAGKEAKRLYQIESTRDEIAAEERDRAQASKVNTWAALRLLQGIFQAFGVVVSISSEEPVYGLKVTVEGFTNSKVSTLACVPPGQYFVESKEIAKGGRTFYWDYAKSVSEIRDPLRPFSASQSKKVIALQFTDSSGREWTRDETGTHARV